MPGRRNRGKRPAAWVGCTEAFARAIHAFRAISMFRGRVRRVVRLTLPENAALI
jgi:hypothetical protein